MGKTKELFMEMAQGFMDGINIERELRGRMADDQYRYSIYNKETKYKTCDKCSYDNLDDNGDVLEHYCEDDELYTPNN